VSTLEASANSPTETEPSAGAGTTALIALAVLHFVVDTIAGQLNPLWPTLERHYQLGPGATFWMLCVWMLTTSFFQLGFGWIGDRAASRWFVWIGPALSCVCLGCLGLSQQVPMLIVLLAVGGLGIAAFHPEGATMSGNCWPQARSRAVSIFSMGGFLGQAIGPPCSGYVVDHFGLPALSGGIVIGLMLIVLLRACYRTAPAPSRSLSATVTLSTLQSLRSQWPVAALLLAAGTSRVVAAAGVPIALAYWLKSRGYGNADIGTVQSAFLGGIGLGSLVSAAVSRPQWERPTLCLLPLAAVPCLLAMPFLDGIVLCIATGLAGLIVGIAFPVFISYGQQLLSASQRVASSLTMGVSWGCGGIVVAALIDLCDRRRSFDVAFVSFAVAIVVSSLLCASLPKPSQVSSA
jgi:FSR family fosmidomycin resistance protein-like MFS transporter